MRQQRQRPWLGLLPGLLLASMLVGVSACAPLAVAPTPPRSALATATAAASATVQAGSSAGASATPLTLPQPNVDPDWVASLQIPDGSKFGGPSVMGTPTSGISASGTMTVGSFKLAPAAQVVVIYGCSNLANVQSTLEIGFDGAAAEIPCSPAGSAASMNRGQWGFAHSDVGRTFPVTVTITTNGPTPRWYVLLEQPK